MIFFLFVIQLWLQSELGDQGMDPTGRAGSQSWSDMEASGCQGDKCAMDEVSEFNSRRSSCASEDEGAQGNSGGGAAGEDGCYSSKREVSFTMTTSRYCHDSVRVVIPGGLDSGEYRY